MFRLSNWKETIFKKDLIAVIINGLLTSILVGMLAGAFDYLFYLIRFQISLGLLLICYAVAFRIRKAYFNYHILYPVLAIFFFILGHFVSMATYYVFVLGSITRLFDILSSWDFYFNFLIFPVYNIYRFFVTKEVLLIFIGIIDLAVFIFSIYVCFRLAGGKFR